MLFPVIYEPGIVRNHSEYSEQQKNKIRRRHIQFQKERKKVKLAAQTLSNGTADGLLFMKQHFPEDFAEVDATATYCRKTIRKEIKCEVCLNRLEVLKLHRYEHE